MSSNWQPFDPKSSAPYPISRSKIEDFQVCRRCFYANVRLGIKQPEKHSAFALNHAVDTLLKKEFDIYRRLGQPHPAMTGFGLVGMPFLHHKPEVFEEWRHTYTGMRYLHKPTNLIVTGAPDDVWFIYTGIDLIPRLSIADYKAGSSKVPLNQKEYWKGYTDQAEVYTWLLGKMGLDLPVSEWAYFVSANADKERERFDNKLLFDSTIIEHQCKTDWIEPVLHKMKECLMADTAPPASLGCKYCEYRLRLRLAGCE